MQYTREEWQCIAQKGCRNLTAREEIIFNVWVDNITNNLCTILGEPIAKLQTKF